MSALKSVSSTTFQPRATNVYNRDVFLRYVKENWGDSTSSSTASPTTPSTGDSAEDSSASSATQEQTDSTSLDSGISEPETENDSSASPDYVNLKIIHTTDSLILSHS